jgi:hypothetical protein
VELRVKCEFREFILAGCLRCQRLLAVVYFLRLIVALFVVLGGFVGENLMHVSPLKGYGINLARSLLGMALFATLSFLDSGRAIWRLVGFIFLLPFFVRQHVTLALLVVAIAAVAIPKSGTLWSPYYRIDFTPMPSPQGSSHPSAHSIVANHSGINGWQISCQPS